MAVVQKGTGVCWGVDGLTYAGTIASATTTAITQSGTATRDSKRFDLTDEDGETVGMVLYDPKTTLNVSVVPTGTTILLATTSVQGWALSPVTSANTAPTVTVADAEGSFDHGKPYILISSTENRTQDGAAVVDLVLEAFANDISSNIAAS